MRKKQKEIQKIKIIATLLGAALLISSVYGATLCSYKGPDTSEHDLQLSDFLVSSDSPVKVGDKVSVSFKLTNVGKYAVTFEDKYGIFVAAKDPDGNMRMVGNTYQGKTLKPKEFVTLETDLTLDKEGVWALWASYCIKVEKTTKCGPEGWHACKITVETKPTPTPIPAPTPTPVCPEGCMCLTEEEAAKLGYSLCQGEKILCGYDQYQKPMYCFEKPAVTPPPEACHYDYEKGECVGPCLAGEICHLNTIYRDPATGKVTYAECTCKAPPKEDTEPPTLDLTHYPYNATPNDTVTFTARASDPSGVAKIELYVNGEKVKECYNTTSCSFIGGPYPEGGRDYSARAVDGLGNSGTLSGRLTTLSIPPPLYIPPPVFCPTVAGSIYHFAYSPDTLKIKADRVRETTMRWPNGTVTPITVIEETRMFNVTIPREFELAYSTDCLSPGTWEIRPLYAPHRDDCRWQGSWSPPFYKINTSEITRKSDAHFTFIPVETTGPDVIISYSPTRPPGDRIFIDDTARVIITASDTSGIASIKIYEWRNTAVGYATSEYLVRECNYTAPPSVAQCIYTGGPYPDTWLLHHEVKVCDGAGNVVWKEGALLIDPDYWCSDVIQNQNETGVDCGGVCPPCVSCTWCGRYVTPIRLRGPPEEKIDIVFVASETSWDWKNGRKVATNAYTANRSLFLLDAEDKIRNWYLNLDNLADDPIPDDFQDRFNFYYYWDPSHFGDAHDGCSGKLPSNFWRDAPFADVAGILYPPYWVNGRAAAGGCANALGPRSQFKAPGFHGGVVIHESGHAVFALVDEYCGDTYYEQNNPLPNVWSSLSNCRNDVTREGWDPNNCRQILWDNVSTTGIDCSRNYWRWNPDPEIMECACGTFGPACVRHINYMFENEEVWRR